MADTREITIDLEQQTAKARKVKFIGDLLGSAGEVFLETVYEVTTAADGTATIDLPVPASGTRRYRVVLPRDTFTESGKSGEQVFYLDAGSAISLASALNLQTPVVTTTQDALDELEEELLDEIDNKEDAIDAGTTGQYWRGDKTWQTLNKAAVGLPLVDNTPDASKPVSTAQALADTAATNAAISAIRNGVVTAGNDLAKVYSLAIKQTLPPNWYNPEDYGAIPINPLAPDDADPSDSAIQDCILDAMLSPNHAPVIVLPGIYALDNDPSQLVNGVAHLLQLYIPLTSYDPDGFGYKTITFMGAVGSKERQGIGGNFLTPFNGSGFYCRHIETSMRGAKVLGSELPTSGVATWGNWNYTTVHFAGGFSILIKTVDEEGDPVVNRMSGVDFSRITQIGFDKVQVFTTAKPENSLEPDANTYGFLFPQGSNHNFMFGQSLVTSGFGVGAYLGEHAKIGSLGSTANRIGVKNTAGYLVEIGLYIAENNVHNFAGEADSFAEIGAYQAENNNSGAWYANINDFYALSTPETMRVNIGTSQAHAPHTGIVPLSLSHPTIDLKIASDELGFNQVPLNKYTTETRPTPLRDGFFGFNTDTKDLEIWHEGQWRKVATTFEEEPDEVDAFFTAAAIADETVYFEGTAYEKTGAQLRTIVQTYVDGLKEADLWDDFIYRLYLMIGGTADTHKYNLKNVAVGVLDFDEDWTHDATGATPDNSSVDTGFNPSTDATGWIANNSLVFYSGTSAGAGNGWNMGVGDTADGNPLFGLAVRRDSGAGMYDSGDATSTGRATGTVADGSGLFIGRCIVSNTRVLFRNGVVVASINAEDTVPVSNGTITIGKLNPTAGTDIHLNHQCRLAAITKGMNDAQIAEFTTLTEAFQTALGRGV